MVSGINRILFAVFLLTLLVSAPCSAWSDRTTRYVAWSAVDFFPPDLASQVRRHHRRYDAGIRKAVEGNPAWRAGSPGKLSDALHASAVQCADDLKRPVPLGDLVEELGVLAVRVLDANDPLAVVHNDPREGRYAAAYSRYVDSILGRVRLVYYGRQFGAADAAVREAIVNDAFDRSRELYPFVGDEFFRTGSLRSWRQLDDRSVAFGVAGVALSRGLTDLANMAAWVWVGGGGRVPEPRPTPSGHSGPTYTVAPRLTGGFEDRKKADESGSPAIPGGTLALPPP